MMNIKCTIVGDTDVGKVSSCVERIYLLIVFSIHLSSNAGI
jgi:hypothetical protein